MTMFSVNLNSDLIIVFAFFTCFLKSIEFDVSSN